MKYKLELFSEQYNPEEILGANPKSKFVGLRFAWSHTEPEDKDTLLGITLNFEIFNKRYYNLLKIKKKKFQLKLVS